ncbi:conserved hypothetical protein [Streptomyces himastatinicus ATCC 53653]|uniref:Luciferase-like domain-containing protein n=1 Tax=Streptomyces himastatinicus ATCC 53653 TaxID=457427 RepID=D9W609_9ACTN|nr:LLM class flavin-dependent oxidoreductase [Streptomyces himastatinicus]EFL20365.1 conserved hypothetical protein [Streptomyces himastatinicus ATCC 53653]
MAAVRKLPRSRASMVGESSGWARNLFDGEFCKVDGLAPAQAPTPPIWTGSMGPASLAVTGRLADAWMPAGAQDWRSDFVAGARPVIDKAAVEAGRDPSLVAPINDYRAGGFVYFPVAETADGQETARYRWAHEIVSAVRAATGAASIARTRASVVGAGVARGGE